MTNKDKDKAAEIALKHTRTYLTSRNGSHKNNTLFQESSVIECEVSAIEMAEWKDKETESTLREAFGRMIWQQDHSLSDKERQYIDIDNVKKIIEDFFHIKLDCDD